MRADRIRSVLGLAGCAVGYGALGGVVLSTGVVLVWSFTDHSRTFSAATLPMMTIYAGLFGVVIGICAGIAIWLATVAVAALVPAFDVARDLPRVAPVLSGILIWSAGRFWPLLGGAPMVIASVLIAFVFCRRIARRAQDAASTSSDVVREQV